jgi:TP901 family phage tail tape measure protein
MGDRELIWAVKAIDHASPALGAVAKSMTNLHHSAFQARTELGQFEKTTNNAGSGAGRFNVSLTALWGQLGVLWGVLKKGAGYLGDFLKFILGIIAKVALAVGAIWALVAALVALGAAGVAAGLGMAAKEAISFELSMARVRGVTGAAKAEIVSLGNTLRQYAKTSTFTPTQLGQASYFMASAGMNTEQIKASMQGVNALAESFNQELAPAAELVVATLAQYGMQATDAARVSNVFAAANGKSLATFEKLNDSMRYAGPIAGALNVRLEETVAALAMLYNAGLRGETAGTMLRMMMLRLITPSTEVTETLLKYGLSLRDVNPMVVGIAGSIGKLIGVNLSAADAAKLFGSETVGAFMSIRAQGGEAALRSMEKSLTGTNAAFEQQAIQADTVAHKWAFLKSSLGELALVFGTPLLEPMKKALTGVSDFINKVSETPQVRGLAAGIGHAFDLAADWLVAKLDWLLANWSTVWDGMMKVLRPFLAGVAYVIGAIIGAFIFLVSKYSEHSVTVGKVWDFIVDAHAKAAGFIIQVMAGIEQVLIDFASTGALSKLPDFFWKVFKDCAKMMVVAMTLGMQEFSHVILTGALGPIRMMLDTFALIPGAIGQTAKAMGKAWDDWAKNMTKDSAQELMPDINKWFDDLKMPTNFTGIDMSKIFNSSDLGKSFLSGFQKAGEEGGLGNKMQAVVRAMMGKGTIPAFAGDNSFIGGLLKSMTDTGGAAATGMNNVLTFVEKMKGEIADAQKSAGGMLSGKPGGMDVDIKMSEEMRTKYEELIAALEDIAGPMVALKDYQSTLKTATEGLRSSVDAQKTVLEEHKTALEANTKVLEEALVAGWEKMTGQGARQWATVGVTRELWKGMRPAALERMIPGASGMSQEELIRALSGNGRYQRAVQRDVRGMNAGELYTTGKTAFDHYGKVQTDAMKKAVELADAPALAQLKAGETQLKAADKQVAAVGLLLTHLFELRSIDKYLARVVGMKLEMQQMGQPAEAANLAQMETLLRAERARKAAEEHADVAGTVPSAAGAVPSAAGAPAASAAPVVPMSFHQESGGFEGLKKKGFGEIPTSWADAASALDPALNYAKVGTYIAEKLAAGARAHTSVVAPMLTGNGALTEGGVAGLVGGVNAAAAAVRLPPMPRVPGGPGRAWSAGGSMFGSGPSGRSMFQDGGGLQNFTAQERSAVSPDFMRQRALLGGGGGLLYSGGQFGFGGGGGPTGLGLGQQFLPAAHASSVLGHGRLWPNPDKELRMPSAVQMITAQNWQKAAVGNAGMLDGSLGVTPNAMLPRGSQNTDIPGTRLVANITIHAPGGDPKAVKQATIDGINEWEATRSGYQATGTGLPPR